MSLKQFPSWDNLLAARDTRMTGQSHRAPRPVGHAHFWHRALTRRQVFKGGAAATALALGAGLWRPAVARAAAPVCAAPNPIPGGTPSPFGLIHFYYPTAPNPLGSNLTIASGAGDPSTITDFNGFVGVSEFGAQGTPDTGTQTVAPTSVYWAADVRFMVGEYIGVNGRHCQGAFAFF